MSVAAVIVCRDQGRALEEALAALADQDRPPTEVVVVDDGSQDVYTRQALTALPRPGVALVRAPRHGLGAALNAGVARVSTPWIVVLEATHRLPAGWLAEARRAVDQDPALDIVAPGSLPDLTPATILARAGEIRPLLVRRDLWDRLGGCAEDPGIGGVEMADFVLRALAAGRRGVTAAAGVPAVPRVVRNLAEARRRLRERHGALVRTLGVELVVAHESWLLDVRDARSRLEREQADTERRLGEVQAEIAGLAGALERVGRPRVDLGDLRRLAPLSPAWGVERGKPMDRYYIERFLDLHRADIRGHVLEVKDPGYSEMFGGDGVDRTDVLDIDDTNPKATIVADLARADAIASDTFDCFILTQTVHIIHDVRGVLRHAHRILKPGGVLLCTLPAVARHSPECGGLDSGDQWRFTEASVRRLFAEIFPPESFTVEIAGNVLVSAAFLYGLAPHELTAAELEHVDPWHPLLFSVRAAKAPRRAAAAPAREGIVLLYHRVAAVESDAAGLAVAPATFRAHMEHLRRDWRPMALADLAAAAAAGDVPERAVAVTFDDGYADALTTVSPILRALGIPATFFVVGETLERDDELWWDTLERALLGPHAVPAALDLVLDGGPERFGTATAADRAAAWRRVNDWMVRAPADARAARLADIVAWSGRTLATRDSHRPLRRAELLELAGHPGHAIGAHGARHLLLPEQPLAAAIQEVMDGKAAVERALGRPVTTFAYPYGGHDTAAVEIVRAARFEVAVTTETRPVRSAEDVLRLPRLDLSRLDADAFFAHLRTVARHRA